MGTVFRTRCGFSAPKGRTFSLTSNSIRRGPTAGFSAGAGASGAGTSTTSSSDFARSAMSAVLARFTAVGRSAATGGDTPSPCVVDAASDDASRFDVAACSSDASDGTSGAWIGGVTCTGAGELGCDETSFIGVCFGESNPADGVTTDSKRAIDGYVPLSARRGGAFSSGASSASACARFGGVSSVAAPALATAARMDASDDPAGFARAGLRMRLVVLCFNPGDF
mmetsp:Transcript_4743/g.15020  ORF Transcript_4743/g.15020 Transcript_4743/m.15020 type:complete len:225 (+) Transcript_4743:1343-2017(+)